MNNPRLPSIQPPSPPGFKCVVPLMAIFMLLFSPTFLCAQQDIPAGGEGSETTVERLGDGINSNGADYAPTVTADGRNIFFVYDRPGGVGGHDFWYITKQSRLDATYSSPQNLGAPVNSTYNEDSPFILPGGQILYFSSKRQGGLGGYDFFISRLGTDGKWMIPEQLAESINSVSNERFINLPAAGDLIYFTSDKEDDFDIFMGLER